MPLVKPPSQARRAERLAEATHRGDHDFAPLADRREAGAPGSVVRDPGTVHVTHLVLLTGENIDAATLWWQCVMRLSPSQILDVYALPVAVMRASIRSVALTQNEDEAFWELLTHVAAVPPRLQKDEAGDDPLEGPRDVLFDPPLPGMHRVFLEEDPLSLGRVLEVVTHGFRCCCEGLSVPEIYEVFVPASQWPGCSFDARRWKLIEDWISTGMAAAPDIPNRWGDFLVGPHGLAELFRRLQSLGTDTPQV